MDADEVKRYVCSTFEGINTAQNDGDTFFIYDPDRNLAPERQMPFVTIVAGDHFDSVSDLNRPGAYRVNVGLTEELPGEAAPSTGWGKAATYNSLFGTAPTTRDEDGVLRPASITPRATR